MAQSVQSDLICNPVKLPIQDVPHSIPYAQAMEQLVEVVQKLSLARSLDTVMEIVRHAARYLTGADGATFILREGDLCHYVTEDAISPLWAGQRFPMRMCISGWVMLNRQPAVIEDIYADERIPADAYRPTFVKSLVMVPIRMTDPCGAIGTYWAVRHCPPPEAVKILQALADTTSVAMENVRLYTDLELRVQERTAELAKSNAELQIYAKKLEALNQQLDDFASVASHDLREPIRKIQILGDRLVQKLGDSIEADAKDYLSRMQKAANRMDMLLQALLDYSHVTAPTRPLEPLELRGVVKETVSDIEKAIEQEHGRVDVGDLPLVIGDRFQMRELFQNLITNALKYRRADKNPVIKIFGEEKNGVAEIHVEDNGIGIDERYSDLIFKPFERLHEGDSYEGTGMGLAICKKIMERHEGTITVRSIPEQGSTFILSLPTVHSGN